MPDLNENHLGMGLSPSHLQGRKLDLPSPNSGYTRKRVASDLDKGTWQRSSLDPLPHLDPAFSNPFTFRWQSGLATEAKGDHRVTNLMPRETAGAFAPRYWGWNGCGEGSLLPGPYEHLQLSTRQKIKTSPWSVLAFSQNITWRNAHR